MRSTYPGLLDHTEKRQLLSLHDSTEILDVLCEQGSREKISLQGIKGEKISLQGIADQLKGSIRMIHQLFQ